MEQQYDEAAKGYITRIASRTPRRVQHLYEDRFVTAIGNTHVALPASSTPFRSLAEVRSWGRSASATSSTSTDSICCSPTGQAPSSANSTPCLLICRHHQEASPWPRQPSAPSGPTSSPTERRRRTRSSIRPLFYRKTRSSWSTATATSPTTTPSCSRVPGPPSSTPGLPAERRRLRPCSAAESDQQLAAGLPCRPVASTRCRDDHADQATFDGAAA